MTFQEFKRIIQATASPVVLLEGKRYIPEDCAGKAQRLATLLSRSFPNVCFRSGNAEGAAENILSPATVGLFYVDPASSLSGGTGHTIRVCQQQGVPVVFQDDWVDWIGEMKLSATSAEGILL